MNGPGGRAVDLLTSMTGSCCWMVVPNETTKVMNLTKLEVELG